MWNKKKKKNDGRAILQKKFIHAHSKESNSPRMIIKPKPIYIQSNSVFSKYIKFTYISFYSMQNIFSLENIKHKNKNKKIIINAGPFIKIIFIYKVWPSVCLSVWLSALVSVWCFIRFNLTSLMSHETWSIIIGAFLLPIDENYST